MLRIFLPLLALLAASPALAAPPAVALTDANGAYIGTAANPLNIAGGAEAAVQSAPGTSAAKADGVQGVTGGVPLTTMQRFYEFSGAIAASTTQAGTIRDSGTASGSVGPYAYFTASAYSDVSGGVLYVLCFDEAGANGVIVGSQNLVAQSTVVVKVAATFRYCRAQINEGTNASALSRIGTMLSAN